MKKTVTLSLVGAALLATTGVAAAHAGHDAPRRGPAAEVTRDQALCSRSLLNVDERVPADAFGHRRPHAQRARLFGRPR